MKPAVRSLAAWVVAGSLAVSSGARAQAVDPAPVDPAPAQAAPAEAPVETAPTEIAPAESAPAQPPPAETAPTDTAPAADLASSQLAPTDLTPPEIAQLRSVQVRLDAVEREEADTSTVLPWTVVVLGVSAVALGLGLGVEHVASCEESCGAPFWPSWALVAGTGVATGGLIWLKLVNEDIAELRSRRFHLEMQVDGYEALREARRQRALLHVGGRF